MRKAEEAKDFSAWKVKDDAKVAAAKKKEDDAKYAADQEAHRLK